MGFLFIDHRNLRYFPVWVGNTGQHRVGSARPASSGSASAPYVQTTPYFVTDQSGNAVASPLRTFIFSHAKKLRGSSSFYSAADELLLIDGYTSARLTANETLENDVW